jgi:arabinofuranan 3-O-arabinosyltransferase
VLTGWSTARRSTGASARPASASVSASVWRLRELLACLALIGLCVTQEPGLIVPDTKLDMAVDPGGFLARAADLWTSQWQFGSLQNQAVGYFFPMGPFFLVGEAIGLPAWLVQRLWMAALLCAAFTGAVRLARALGIGGAATRLLAGAVFALSPRALSLVGTVSLELLPYCVAPWVVLPLVRGAAGGSKRRAAALSGLAVVCMGGANGAAVVCAVLPAFLYLVTRPPGRRRWSLLACWMLAMVAATFWWLVPLLLLQQHGFPFLPYTESAAVTTAPSSLPAAITGVTHWVGYLAVDGVPWWRAGWALVTVPLLMVATALIGGLGVIGLARRDLPERRFLLIAALVGLLTLTAGNLALGGAAFAATVREVLDGPAAALRNLHKFDVVLRLPLALAAAHLLDSVGRISALRRFPRPADLAPRRAAIGLTAVTLVAVATGAGTAGLAAHGGFPALPEHWRQTADWLDRHAGHGTTLLVPGSNFAEYGWGRPMDEPIQPLLESRWAVRALVPAGSAGNARLLSAIDERLTSGVISPGLADVLGRLGVRYLVVRNDLRPAVGAPAWPVLVHRTLDNAPGLSRVAQFGPMVGADPDFGGAWDYGLHRPYPAVEIYRVDRPARRAELVDAADALNLVGAPETLLDLADAGLLGDRPVILDGDPRRAPTAGTVLADSLRNREVDFGLVRGNISRTLTSDKSPRQPRAVHDILDPTWRSSMTTAGYDQVTQVLASSTAADVAGPAGLRDPSASPYAAVDGDPGTAWLSDGARKPVGQWLEVRLPRSARLDSIDLQMVEEELLGAAATWVEVTTAAGSLRHRTVGSGRAPARLALPPGPTDFVRVTIGGVADLDVPGRRAGIRELRIPYVDPGRYLRLPDLPAESGAPELVALTRRAVDRPACTDAGDHYVCAPDLIRRGEETGIDLRRFKLPAATTAQITGLARPTATTALQTYDDLVGGPRFGTSSAWFADPVASSRALGDGDDGTAWWADPDDPQPRIELRWSNRRTVSWIRLRFPATLVAAPPRSVQITGDGGIREAAVGPDGVVRFKAMRTRGLAINVTSVVPRVNRSTALFEPQSLPLGLSGVDVEGVPEANEPRDLGREVTLPCGTGPAVLVNGVRVATTADTTLRDLRDLRPLSYRACGTEASAGARSGQRTRTEQLRLPAGPNGVSAPMERFVVDSVILVGGSGASRADQEPYLRPVTVTGWNDHHRVVEVGAGAGGYFVVPENANPGWRATVDGVPLASARLDGWKQAWHLPAGAGNRVELVFTPGEQYQLVLRIAVGLLAALLIAALIPVRRRRLSYPPMPDTLPAAPLLAVAVPALLGGPVGFGAALLVVVPHLRRVPDPAWIWVPALLGLTGHATQRSWSGLIEDEGLADLLAGVPSGLLLGAVAALVLRYRRVRGRDEIRQAGWRRSRARERGDEGGGLDERAGRWSRFRRPAAYEASAQPLERPLDEVVAEGGDRDGEGQADQEESPERGVEPGEPEQPEADLDREQVPEEDAVGDPAEEPDHRITDKSAG